ncbi:RhoGEF domain-containing protein [Trichophaea hybrida]|nr:RhoGEF domain-containing protein [Trichophaea hybrida]
MASLSSPAPNLTTCTPYCAIDPVIGHVIVFYGSQAQLASSLTPRIEAHIFSCAGFQSYPRLALAPSSPLYAAINHLPPQKQASGLHRGLAITVLKYFSELPKTVKETILRSESNAAPAGEQQAVAFDQMHAGDLAARLKEVESETMAHDLMWALSERFLGALDVDIVVRSSNIEQEFTSEYIPEQVEQVLNCFGEPTYLPFTRLKRSASKPASAATRPRSFQHAVEALDRELDELRYTEANYVGKLRDLSGDIVNPLKRRPSSRKGEAGSLSLKELDALFPPCLEKIIEVNSRFLEGIHMGGVEEVSKCCMEVFPTFKEPYEEYIRASAEFPHLIAKFTKNKDSSFSKKIQQTGEQKLRSLIIEPVQRLPRYSLLIDNIINILPPEHHSLRLLNDARSTVDEICSLQSSETGERTITVKRLQNIIASWPLPLQPTGRLITAVDFLEVLPPFNDTDSETIQSILLLFPDCVAILRRPSSKSLLARGVMAEIDRPNGGVGTSTGSGNRRDGCGNELQFIGWIDIADVKLADSDDGTVLWVTLTSNLKDGWDNRACGSNLHKMKLLNQYEGRAYKVEEEFAKARLERRVGHNAKGIIGVRETKYAGLMLWSCIWGSQTRYVKEKRKGSIVIYLDIGCSGSTAGRSVLISAVGKDGVDIAFSLEESKGKLRFECRSWNDYTSTDMIHYEELLPVFTTRLISLLRLHSTAQYPPLTTSLISANRRLLQSLGVQFEGEGRFSKLRPPSPVKLFSSILHTPNIPSKSRVAVLERIQNQLLPPTERSQSMFQRGTTVFGLVDDCKLDDGEARHRITMAGESPLKRLEDTFEAFVNALRMVGSAGVDLGPLYQLHQVDVDAVKLLSGQLAADPTGYRIGQDTGIDVVFAAFAKFLNHQWKEGMGPVVSETALNELQQKSCTLHPGDFKDFFRLFVLDWTPQNKRAFRTLILLLKEIQEKVDADDDKGTIINAFTKLVVDAHVNALDYMGLINLLVEDVDTLFREAPAPRPEHGNVKRAKSVSNGSAPSLRKRLGLKHTSSMRENKIDKSHSMWRTLSKRDKEGIKTPLELSKFNEHSTRSRELLKPEDVFTRDQTSSQDDTAITRVGEAVANHSTSFASKCPVIPTHSEVADAEQFFTNLSSSIQLQSESSCRRPRRMRRSSLSDLTNHQEYHHITVHPSLRSQSELATEVKGPVRDLSSSSSLSHGETNLSEKSVESLSEIPMRKFSPRQSGAVTMPQRLKMQSPQKLRERLHIEKQAIMTIDSNLQQEIDLIGIELNSPMNFEPSFRISAQQSLNDVKQHSLASRLSTIEARINSSVPYLEIEKLKNQLLRKNNELKDLDKLLKDYVAENDVMFEQFNEEIVKMSNGFKLGKGESELLDIVRRIREEQGRLKRENMCASL